MSVTQEVQSSPYAHRQVKNEGDETKRRRSYERKSSVSSQSDFPQAVMHTASAFKSAKASLELVGVNSSSHKPLKTEEGQEVYNNLRAERGLRESTAGLVNMTTSAKKTFEVSPKGSIPQSKSFTNIRGLAYILQKNPEQPVSAFNTNNVSTQLNKSATKLTKTANSAAAKTIDTQK